MYTTIKRVFQNSDRQTDSYATISRRLMTSRKPTLIFLLYNAIFQASILHRIIMTNTSYYYYYYYFLFTIIRNVSVLTPLSDEIHYRFINETIVRRRRPTVEYYFLLRSQSSQSYDVPLDEAVRNGLDLCLLPSRSY